MRAIVLAVVLVASPALAQETPATTAPPLVAAPPAPADSAQIPQAIDPLADLISQSGQETDEDAAEAAEKPAPKHKATLLPPPEPEAPVAAGAPLTKAQIYEMRVKGSIAAAQSLQGPLDGGWKVVAPDGSQLYALQIVDKAGDAGVLEGAWRDVRRPGAVGSTGLIDDLRRDGADVIVRFSPRGGQTSSLTLRPAGEARWLGELVEDGATVAVRAEHVLPEAPPGYETDRRGPYVWPVAQRAAPSRPEPAAPACSVKGKKGKALKAAKARCVAARKAGKGSAARKGGKSKAKATPVRKGKAAARKPTRKKRR